MFNSGFRSLSKFEFKCSGIQQRGAIVLDSMSFEAVSCRGGASISICASRALIFRVLVRHILGSTTVIMMPCMLLLAVVLVYPLIHTFSILFLQLKKLRRYNKSAIDLSNTNPGHGHQELRQSAGHIKVKALKPTGIQDVTISRYNKRRTSELRSTVSSVWNVASVSGSELQPTKRLSEVLPNQQSHQK